MTQPVPQRIQSKNVILKTGSDFNAKTISSHMMMMKKKMSQHL